MAILRNILIYTAAALSLSSCYTDFEPEINEKSVLCLNSLITADEPVTVYVSHTYRYTESSNNFYSQSSSAYVKDADVQLYINDKYVENLTYTENSGYSVTGNQITYSSYKSTYAPKQGDRVRIVAKSSEYGEAIGEETVPYAVPIEDVEFVPTLTGAYTRKFSFISDPNYGFNVVRFECRAAIRFTDPANQTNYYTAEITPSLPAEIEEDSEIHDSDGETYHSQMVYFIEAIMNYEAEPLFSEHISALEALMGGDSFDFNYFTDEQISGKTYTANLRYYDTEYCKRITYTKDIAYHLTMNVKLGSVTQSYYYWQLYNWKAENSMQGQLSDYGMSEQLSTYSNVSTGAGVISARAFATYPVDLADFIRASIAED